VVVARLAKVVERRAEELVLQFHRIYANQMLMLSVARTHLNRTEDYESARRRG